MSKKKIYTYWDKCDYYGKKAKKQYKEIFYNVKNEDYNWWKYYYYLNRYNGFDHAKAYQKATSELMQSKEIDRKLIKDFTKFFKGKKIPDEKLDPIEIALTLFEIDVKNAKKTLKNKKKLNKYQNKINI